MIAPFCHKWIFDEKSEVNVDFPDDWKNRSLQERLNSIDGLLLNDAKFILLPKIEQLNIRRQLKDRITSDVESPKPTVEELLGPRPVEEPKKEADLSFLPDQPKLRLIGYFFSFEAGWRELSLLAFVGFASPWLINLFIRWVIIAFIVGGFKDKTNGAK
jgi:hypothetical protein